jgi:serine phosphatase RsbU (regulator of sigma subunit)
MELGGRDTRTYRRPFAGAALAMSLLCSTIGLTWVTAATANPAHRHPGKPQQAQSTPTPAPPPAAAQSATGAQAPAAPAAQPVGAGEQAHAEHGQGHTAPALHRHGRTPAATTPKTQKPHGTATTTTQAGATTTSAASSTRTATVRQHRQMVTRTQRTPKHPKAAAPPAEPPPAAPAVPTPAVAAAVSTSPAIVAPAPAAAKSQAVSSAPTRRAPTRARRAAKPARVGATLTGAVLAIPAIAATPATGARPAGHAPAAKASPQRSSESPLVKTVRQTVTRIIGVVPPWMRVLIGGLVALVLALAASSQLAAMRARRLARQRQALLEDVGLLQAALLPALPGRLGPVGTTAAYRPASGPGAGGDFYDVFALGDGQLAVIVGDVSGHGRDALPHTTLLRFTLRAYLEAGLSPRAALQTAAPVLERQLGDSFATVVLATYHPRDRVLVYSCAGHPPPLVLGTEAIVPITACSAPPIGVGQPTGTRQTAISIPGATLACFYTDGVIEARVAGELFGSERLEQVLAGLGEEATAASVLDRVAEGSDRHPDDMAACVLRVEGDADLPTIELEELELDGPAAASDRAERFLLACGVHPSETAEAVESVRGAVARHGRVVLELHLGEGEPAMVLRPQNIATLEPLTREAAATRRMVR